jgi:hypothetical protein
MEMKQVIATQQGNFTHKQTGISFQESPVLNAEGKQVLAGVAVVPDAVAAQFFNDSERFTVLNLGDDLKLSGIKIITEANGTVREEPASPVNAKTQIADGNVVEHDANARQFINLPGGGLQPVGNVVTQVEQAGELNRTLAEQQTAATRRDPRAMPGAPNEELAQVERQAPDAPGEPANEETEVPEQGKVSQKVAQNVAEKGISPSGDAAKPADKPADKPAVKK